MSASITKVTTTYFRADVTPASIEAWQRAGLCRAFVGAEAFTQTALDRMNKRRSVEQNTSAVEAFCEAGIPVEVSHVIGFPGETLGDVHQSWSYYQQLRQRYGNRIMLNLEPFQFCPASQVYEHPEDFGLSVTPWPEEVFRGRGEYRELLAEVPMAVQGEPDVPELMARVATLRATFAPDPESGREFHSHWIRRFRLRQLRGLKPGYVVELTTPGVKVLPVRREGAGAHLFGKVFALYRDGAVLDVLDERRRCIYEGVLAQRPLADIVWELVALHGGDAGHEMEEIASCLEALLDIGLQFSIRPSCGLGAEGEPLLED